jgi:hypothetical protein
MKIHYISDHSVLEYDEVQLLLDLGHEVFSNGAYLDPAGHVTLPRPGLRGAKTYPQYVELARSTARTDLPAELIDPFDVVIVMHSPNVIVQNWSKLRGKRVIWRSIGQSVPGIENRLAPCRDEGLQIVRYSPKEANIPGFIGSDAMIRFYKDEDEYKAWTGELPQVVSFAQSLKGRREFCHFEEVFGVIEAFNGKVYGPGNEDLGQFNGGQVPYEQQVAIMQQSRAMPYGGTWPAPYTLSFIEALMTGLPIVAISKTLAHYPQYEAIDFYEVDEILAEIGGLVCDTEGQMIGAVQRLLHDPSHALDISKKQRTLALQMFSKKVISKQWKEFLGA